MFENIFFQNFEKSIKRDQKYPHAACPSRPRWGSGGAEPPGGPPRGLFFLQTPVDLDICMYLITVWGGLILWWGGTPPEIRPYTYGGGGPLLNCFPTNFSHHRRPKPDQIGSKP